MTEMPPPAASAGGAARRMALMSRIVISVPPGAGSCRRAVLDRRHQRRSSSATSSKPPARPSQIRKFPFIRSARATCRRCLRFVSTVGTGSRFRLTLTRQVLRNHSPSLFRTGDACDQGQETRGRLHRHPFLDSHWPTVEVWADVVIPEPVDQRRGHIRPPASCSPRPALGRPSNQLAPHCVNP